MTVAVAVAAAATSTGTQDITTTDLGGATPKAALFLYSRAASDGTITAHAGASFGATDGTNQWAVAAYVRDALTSQEFTTSMGDVGKSDKCVCALHVDGTLVVHSEAAFDSFIVNGVRINWTTAAADGWLLTVVLFAGSDWSVACGIEVSVASAAVNFGFQPDVVLFSSRGSPSPTGFDGTISAGSRGRWSIGGQGWSPTLGRTGVAQGAWSWPLYNQDVGWSAETTGSCGVQFEVSSSPYGIDVNRTATGFTFGTAYQEADQWGYLALKWDGGTAYCDALEVTAATGDQSFVGTGFEPEWVLLLPSINTVNDAPQFTRGLGIVAMTATKLGGFASSGRSDATEPSASNPTIRKSVACEDEIHLLVAAGTEGAAATLASLDNDGFTLNFTNAPDATWIWPFIAFGPSGGGGGGGAASRNQAWIID